MRTSIKLRVSLTIIFVLLIILGLSSCGTQPGNNVASPNSNANRKAENTNADSATTTAPMCTSVQDAAITKAMKDGVVRDKDLLARKDHFNYFSYGCTVYLVGYVDNIVNFKNLYKIAADAPGIQKIDISNLWLTKIDAGEGPVNGACPGDGVPCGEICLPPGQVCNTDDIIVPLTTPSPTP